MDNPEDPRPTSSQTSTGKTRSASQQTQTGRKTVDQGESSEDDESTDGESHQVITKNLKDLTPAERRVASVVRDKMTVRMVTIDVFPGPDTLHDWIEFDFNAQKKLLLQQGKDVRGKSLNCIFSGYMLIHDPFDILPPPHMTLQGSPWPG